MKYGDIDAAPIGHCEVEFPVLVEISNHQLARIVTYAVTPGNLKSPVSIAKQYGHRIVSSVAHTQQDRVCRLR